MDEPKYQVGDLVRVREDATSLNGLYFNPEMEKYKGRELVVSASQGFSRRFAGYIYKLATGDGRGWDFHEEWLEPDEYQSVSENENEAIDDFLSEFQ